MQPCSPHLVSPTRFSLGQLELGLARMRGHFHKGLFLFRVVLLRHGRAMSWEATDKTNQRTCLEGLVFSIE